MKKYSLFLLLVILFVSLSCGKRYTDAEKAYIAEVEKERQGKDEYFRDSPDSPFNSKSKVHFEPLKYFDVDPEFVFKSKLIQYEKQDTITILGTKGEERKAIRFGYIPIQHEGKDVKIKVYKGFTSSGMEYFSIWFTDNTTVEETYGVGRYLDFELNSDKDFVYTIDFNKAYNPYCAYNSDFTCAVPTKEDHIDLSIKAGEKNFH